MPTYERVSGEVVEYPKPAPAVAAFLARVEAAAANPATAPAALLALVYSAENPTLDTTTAPGHAIIGAAALANPVYHVLADMAFRKQLAAAGKTPGDVAAGFTVSVQAAAEQLGITEASVRAAITARKLAAHKRNGQWYTKPEAVAAYKVSNRGRKRTAPEPAGVRVRCGGDAGDGEDDDEGGRARVRVGSE